MIKCNFKIIGTNKRMICNLKQFGVQNNCDNEKNCIFFKLYKNQFKEVKENVQKS